MSNSVSALHVMQNDEDAVRQATNPPIMHKVRNFTARTVAADCATSLAVGLSAALPISIIDYSIMARVAGVTDSSLKELRRGIQTLLLRPHKFFLPCAENKCALVYAVCVTSYSLTYSSSNLTKSYFESHGMESKANLAAGVSSGVVNTLLSIWKDGIILKSLPPKNPQDIINARKKIPWLTRGLFATRDILTCVGAFTLAPMLANYIAPYVYHSRSMFSSAAAPNALPRTMSAAGIPVTDSAGVKAGSNHEGKIPLPMSNVDAAQLMTPVGLQFVTTVFHILAIRYRQTYPRIDVHDFVQSMKNSYIAATSLRMCRIIPAFGIGGIMNTKMRSNLLDIAEPNAPPR